MTAAKALAEASVEVPASTTFYRKVEAVIVTDGPGLPRTTTRISACLTFDPADASTIADALESLAAAVRTSAK